MFHVVSTLVLILIALGLWRRFDRKTHISLMLSAFAIDLVLVLIIEFQRHVVEDVISDPQQMGGLTLFHIVVSTVVLVLYGLLIWFGVGIIRHKPGARAKHKTFAIAFIVLRLINYVTSFMIVP